jgi:hypothetical protein
MKGVPHAGGGLLWAGSTPYLTLSPPLPCLPAPLPTALHSLTPSALPACLFACPPPLPPAELACLTLYLAYEKKRGEDSCFFSFIKELDRLQGRGSQVWCDWVEWGGVGGWAAAWLRGWVLTGGCVAEQCSVGLGGGQGVECALRGHAPAEGYAAPTRHLPLLLPSARVAPAAGMPAPCLDADAACPASGRLPACRARARRCFGMRGRWRSCWQGLPLLERLRRASRWVHCLPACHILPACMFCVPAWHSVPVPVFACACLLPARWPSCHPHVPHRAPRLGGCAGQCSAAAGPGCRCRLPIQPPPRNTTHKYLHNTTCLPLQGMEKEYEELDTVWYLSGRCVGGMVTGWAGGAGLGAVFWVHWLPQPPYHSTI